MRREFNDAYTAWREAPFPKGSANDSLDELHADLVLPDTWVADTVIPFVESGLYRPAKIDVVDELRQLRIRAVQLAHARDSDDRRLADSYREYVERLIRVYEALLTMPAAT